MVCLATYIACVWAMRGSSTRPVCRCRINALQIKQDNSKAISPGPHTTLRRKIPLEISFPFRNRFFPESAITSVIYEFFCCKRTCQKFKRSRQSSYFSNTGFFANPLYDVFCVSRANFEISGNPDFCTFSYANAARKQQNSQNK